MRTQDLAAALDIREACPTPLTACEVRATLQVEAPLWTFEHAGRRIQGRTLGDGPPLYLLNGLVGTHELYGLLAWVLREQVRCVLFDWPLDGSRRPIEASAEDLFAVADFHGDERFSVLGTSFGGLVALAAMLQRPHRIERAVLHAGFASRRFSRFERLLIRVGRWLPGTFSGVPFREAVLRNNHRPWFPPFDTARFRFLLDDTGAAPIRAVAARAAVIREADLRRRLPEIRQPVLLVRTEGEGAVLSGLQDELAAGLPHARTEWLHTCGQLPHLTHPHRLAKLVRSFLLEQTRST